MADLTENQLLKGIFMRQLVANIVIASSVLLSNNLFAAQTCLSSAERNKPNVIYSDNNDGTVNDDSSGLVWSKCLLGQTYSAGACSGVSNNGTWKAALEAAQQANTDNLLGHNDWRLPSVAELRTLVDRACASPASNNTLFPDSSGQWTWSSSPSTGSADAAWAVYFDDGSEQVQSKSNSYAVRFVRDAQ